MANDNQDALAKLRAKLGQTNNEKPKNRASLSTSPKSSAAAPLSAASRPSAASDSSQIVDLTALSKQISQREEELKKKESLRTSSDLQNSTNSDDVNTQQEPAEDSDVNVEPTQDVIDDHDPNKEIRNETVHAQEDLEQVENTDLSNPSESQKSTATEPPTSFDDKIDTEKIIVPSNINQMLGIEDDNKDDDVLDKVAQASRDQLQNNGSDNNDTEPEGEYVPLSQTDDNKPAAYVKFPDLKKESDTLPVKPDDIQSDNIQSDGQADDVQNKDIQSDNDQADNIQSDSPQVGDDQAEDAQNKDVQDDETKSDLEGEAMKDKQNSDQDLSNLVSFGNHNKTQDSKPADSDQPKTNKKAKHKLSDSLAGLKSITKFTKSKKSKPDKSKTDQPAKSITQDDKTADTPKAVQENKASNKPKVVQDSFIRRHPGLKKTAIIGGSAVAVVLLSIGAGYAWSKWDEAHDKTPTAQVAKKKTQSAKAQSSSLAKSQSKKEKKEEPLSPDSDKNKPVIESNDNSVSAQEKDVQKQLNLEAKATKQPYKITTAKLGGGYIQGIITYYPKDSSKTYNDYSITAPKKPGSGTGDSKSRDIEHKLKADLPTINKTIKVRDKHKVTMRTYKQDDGTYNTILLYSDKPFGFVKTDKKGKMVNNVTTYYIQKVVKN